MLVSLKAWRDYWQILVALELLVGRGHPVLDLTGLLEHVLPILHHDVLLLILLHSIGFGTRAASLLRSELAAISLCVNLVDHLLVLRHVIQVNLVHVLLLLARRI